MTPQRASMIKAHWERYRDVAGRYLSPNKPVFFAPVVADAKAEMQIRPPEAPEVLAFTLHVGWWCLAPAYRICCESVMVECGPRMEAS